MPGDLPSVRFEPDDPRPSGFVAELNSGHLRAAGEALRDVASMVEEVTAANEPILRVRLASVRYMPALPFVLYSFHIVRVDDEGEFTDEVDAGEEITYAIVANHAVEVQREAAVLFLFELVARQEALAGLRSQTAGSIAQSLEAATAIADQQSRQEFRDRIASGWRAATRAIAHRALASGRPLAVRYEVDVLPSREDVVRRMRVLRSAYNEIDIAREAVDKTVSLIGGRDPRISGGTLSQKEMNRIQRQIASLSFRQWVSQTTRDAEVCGNGYLVTKGTPEPLMYNLRPEDVEIVGQREYRIIRNGVSQSIDGDVRHFTGIEQFESPYGISMLEPVLAEYRTRRVFVSATEFAQRVVAERPAQSSETRWAQQTLALAERSLAASGERLGRLLWYPRDWLRDAREGLYFPGQERM